ncbi:hypothetical protein LFREDSHE_07480 [Shewanella baltica]
MPQLSPWQHYQKDLTRDGFSHDPAQEIAVKALQRVYEDLTAAEEPSSIVGKLFSALGLKSAPASPKGLYLWGGVGRGKTYLMDTFLMPCLAIKSCGLTSIVSCISYI